MLDDTFKIQVAQALQDGEERMRRLEIAAEEARLAQLENKIALQENTSRTNATYNRTNDMYEVFSAMKGGFKVLEWLATLGKVAAGIAAGTVVVFKAMGWKWPWSS